MIEEPNNPASPPPRPSEIARFEGHHRFIGWAFLFFCSIISLAAKTTDTWGDERGKDETFVIAVSAISIGCSFLAIMGYAIARWNFPGSPFEGLFAVVCCLIWICGMPVIMDPDRNIAVSKGVSQSMGDMTVAATGADVRTAEFTYIRNANIYFFSWASTIAIVYICGRFVRQCMKKTTEVTVAWTGLWYLSTMASLVVLVDATKLFVAFDCTDSDEDAELCTKTTYAVSLGTLGTLLSLVAGALGTCGLLNNCLEMFSALLVFVLYMAGVTLLTFDDGPGTSIGNLYFATWMGVFVSAVLLGRSYFALVQQYMNKRHDKHKKSDDHPQEAEAPKPEEPPVVFPDVEMGRKEEEGVEVGDDGHPSWAKEEPEEKSATEKEEGQPSWAKEESEDKTPVEKEVEVKPAPAKETPEKTTKSEKQEKAKAKKEPEPDDKKKDEAKTKDKGNDMKEEESVDKKEPDNAKEKTEEEGEGGTDEATKEEK